ncbi:hypothetical protein Tsubulata_010584 [Turnera subulata]|uniref:Uncharacterized protein n=1 Tax=Turnera subulata TaxID=218843 RepID=A0A9Q0JLT3_9ROSI|nr:hypothetical protein Tsubulata_010584 [Turnera subulata]
MQNPPNFGSSQKMGVFYHEESTNPARRCKFLTATLKDVFSNCHTCSRLSTSSPKEEHDDVDDEQEVVLSEIRSRAMEKLKQKSFVLTDSFTWVYSPKTGELFVAPKSFSPKLYDNNNEDDDDDDDDSKKDKEDEERDEFFSVRSCFSCCSSVLSKEAFLSVKSNFSRCSSFKGFEFQDFPRNSILQQFYHCEGWPFGLCRKAVLLPPLPKSPSDSWLWRKGTRTIKMTY